MVLQDYMTIVIKRRNKQRLMKMTLINFKTLVMLLSTLLLFSCATTPVVPKLAQIDSDITKSDKAQPLNKGVIKPKSKEEIRRAYTEYLNSASADDNSRVNALNRLAELEFIYSNKLLQEKEEQNETSDEVEDREYEQRLDKTINLLSTSLNDYPDEKNNDLIMYQLAKALDQKGQHLQSVETLLNLVERFPKSPYYVESQFRIAEDAFANQNYSTAEYSYTEVIVAPENDIFYEKSLFKRG